MTQTTSQFKSPSQIEIGSIWQPTDGTYFFVRVYKVDLPEKPNELGWVYYHDVYDPTKIWDKDSFAFQVRYFQSEIDPFDDFPNPTSS